MTAGRSGAPSLGGGVSRGWVGRTADAAAAQPHTTMSAIRVLLFASVLAVAVARPQDVESLLALAPSPVYAYRFSGPQQTKQESRDALGNIEGSYSVTYPDNGGTLTYSYAHPARQPVFRTTADGPLGPAGTVITIGKNSKDNAFLIEMMAQRIDSRDPPIVTKTEAVLIEALPATEESESTTSVQFQAGKTAGAGDRPNQVRAEAGGQLTRGGFVNSKESLFLPDIRAESLENEVLGARNPPIITDEEIIVEALPDDSIESGDI